MRSQFEQTEPENFGVERNSLPQQEEPRAPGAVLPPTLDAFVNKLAASAIKRCGKRGLDIEHLIKVISIGKYTDAEFEAVLNALNPLRTGPKPQNRACAWLLGTGNLHLHHMSEAAVWLRAILQRPPSQLLMPGEKRIQRATAWSSAASALISLGIVVAINRADSGVPFLISLFLLSLLLFNPVLFLIIQLELRAARKLRLLAAYSLGRLGSVDAIDALAAASLEHGTKLAEVSQISLRALLPQLSADHYGRLHAQVARNLCRILKLDATKHQDRDGAFRMKLLDALEKIGGAEAIAPIVEAASHWGDGREDLQEAAARVVVVLEERKRRETERGTLLRGAEEPMASPVELLRAANARAESRPEQMLRPVD